MTINRADPVQRPDVEDELYQPIKPFQTRIIRLHSELGPSETPIVCSLYVADVLHSSFRAVGLRSLFDEDTCSLEDGSTCAIHEQDTGLAPYDALSYTWGGQESNRQILCNGFPFSVTDNLFDALLALRKKQSQHQFLWVDAICINQDDDDEKSYQVQNMFSIYDNATRVIAWLGTAKEEVQDAINTVATVEHSQPSENDLRRLWQGLWHLYSNPWFERIWVQQEVFSAHELILQCGTHQLDLDLFMLNIPQQIMERLFPLALQPEVEIRPWLPYSPDFKQLETEITADSEKSVGPEAFARLQDLLDFRLRFFRRISPSRVKTLGWVNSSLNIQCDRKIPHNNHNYPHAARQLDFVDTMMDTGILKATNPRDYIYGILGMTGFPAKKISYQQWVAARCRGEFFIPIDYTADLKSILCAVTWLILIKGGLKMLAKFKVFGASGAGVCDDLPSWAIDWSLSARSFGRQPRPPWAINLETIWENHRPTGEEGVHPIHHHNEFCIDNRDTSLHHTRLVVRGFIETRYFVDGKHVWQRRMHDGNRKVWALEVDLLPTDLVVFLTASGPRDYWVRQAMDDLAPSWVNGGLWLLRPEADGECHSIVAFLAWPHDIDRGDMVYPYPGNRWEPKAAEQAGDTRSPYRRLAVKGPFESGNVDDEEYEPYEPPTQPLRRFIIV